NLLVGFFLQIVALVGFQALGLTPGQTTDQVSIWLFIPILAAIATFLFHILQGYLAKNVLATIVGSACLTGGALLARTLPILDPTVAGVSKTHFILSEALDGVLMMGISCAGYLGAFVQTRAAKEANLQRNDQATLLAEMVRIQWKLSNEAATICVMVVDAAKSSEMKADADPLAVEYTFREYQEWIEAISVPRKGRVHSTAGDGAVVAFDTCDSALAAARRIQTDVFQFNKDVNRLAQPFRLRIGLHSGEVVGDINQVQFTEVIDIAAHIESACPVGGITVTDEVVNRLPEEQFIDLKARVDGHEIFLVANPTEYH
ncbi:MAG TPA: adenylate/guanylate cyclase domain-containing protein, partial [Fimbriimonadaceae bacterium]|nr:adenylate/guanylate cyclase domain-containing protein [Fimbriimonadaceae bacterium]